MKRTYAYRLYPNKLQERPYPFAAGLGMARQGEAWRGMARLGLARQALLSIVPLLAVIFSVFSLFPVFQDWRGEVESFVFKNFVPTLGEAIQGYLVRFVENATKMTSLGLVVLFLVALLLISSIDHTLNHIWRVRKNRR